METSRMRQIPIAMTLLLLAALALSACGFGGGGGSTGDQGNNDTGATAATGGSGDAGAAANMAEEGGVETTGQTTGGTGGDTAGRQRAPVQSGAAAAPAASQHRQGFDRLVIRTGTLTLRVSDVAKGVTSVQQIASKYRGYVSNGSTREERRPAIADITITIPSESFDQAFSELRGLGKLVSDSAQSQDVTEEYVDLRSRQRNLEATQKRLLTLLNRASTVGEVLNVQRELTTVQGQFEEIKGRLQYLGNRTTMSTITVSLRPVLPPAAKPTPKPIPRWSAFEVAERAWLASLRMLQGVATAVISVVVFGWWLIPILLVGLLLWMRRGGTRRGFRRGPGVGPEQTAGTS